VRTSLESPWQNGVAERWVESCRRDLLDHVIVVNERHLKRLLSEYVGYYHEDRTHLGLGKGTPNHSIDPVKVSFDLHRSVAIVRVGQLGALGKAVELLAHGFRQLFEAADTPNPVRRHRRGVPVNRRVARSPK
jgi:hypothetical protein